MTLSVGGFDQSRSSAVFLKPTLAIVFLSMAALQARISEIAVEFHELPSFILPLAALLIVATVGCHILDNRLASDIPNSATTLVALFLFLIVGIRLPGLITATDREIAVENLVIYLKDSMIVLAVVFAAERVAGLKAAIAGFVTAGTLIASLTVHKAMSGNVGSNYFGFSQSTEALVSAEESGIRYSGPFEDPNFYAQSLVVVLGLAVGIMIGPTAPKIRWAAAVATAVCVAAIGLSLSRGGMMAALTIVGVVVLRRFRLRMVLGAVAAFFVLGLLLPLPLTDRLTSVTEAPSSLISQDRAADPSVNGRTSEALAAIAMFSDHPILGVGTGNYDSNYLDYSTTIGLDARRTDRAAHNLFLEAAAELGLVGIVGFALFVTAPVVVSGRVRKRLIAQKANEEAALAEGLQLAVIAYMVSAVFLHDAFSRLFVLVVAMGLAAVMLDREESRQPSLDRQVRETAPRAEMLPV